MSNKQTSIQSLSNDEDLFCPNCGSNILQIRANDEKWLKVCYDFNRDTYTCLDCNKVIMDSETISELNSRINPKSFFEYD